MAFKVPTIFTAIDKFTAPVRKMRGVMKGFNQTVNTGLARSERAFRKLMPSISGATKQFIQFAKAALFTTAIISGAAFTVTAIQDYEKNLASLSAITGVTGQRFELFKSEVLDTASATKKSSVEVAKAFEIVGSAQPELLKSASALAAVTKASIILSKASGDDLQVSAESLTGVMNQFNKSADQAATVMNVLAAGSVAGASNITDVALSMKNFGSVAAGANITVEQSVALIEVLGKFNLKGAEAGTKLRGSVLKLQQANLGYISGQFDVNDALLEANKKIDALATAQEKDAAILKIFGAENITAGKILLKNIGLFDQYTNAVTGTNTAVEQAAINSDTLTVALDEAKAAWVNIITTSDKANGALSGVKRTIQFVTNNMETIVSVGAKVIGFFLLWKGLMIATRTVMAIYNIALGVHVALTRGSAFALRGSAIALAAFSFVTKAATAAQWLLNIALNANPIGLIVIAVAAMVAVVALVITKWNEWGAALSLFLGPIGLIIGMVQSFRRNWDMIKQAFKEGGILAGLKAIGATLLDVILMPLQQILKIAARLPGGIGRAAAAGVESIAAFRKDIGVNVTTDESGNPIETPLVNTAKANQTGIVNSITETKNSNIAIDIKDGTGNATVESDDNSIPINLTSTLAL